MQSSSPTLEGFRAIFRCPSFGLAEIAWRWTFGATAGVLISCLFFEYLDTLTVSRGDLLLLRSRQPVLISRAIQHVFERSGLRLLEAAILLALALTVGWIAIAGIGRAATIKALLDYFCGGADSPSSDLSALGVQPRSLRLRSLFGLNFFRAGGLLAAAIGCVAAFLAAGAASSFTNPSPGAAFLIFLTVIMLVSLTWYVLNWFLSLASVLVVVDSSDTFGAMSAAVDFCRNRPGSILAASFWFGLAHITAFVVATSLVAFPLGLAGVLPAGMVLGGVLSVTLLYFVVADFLYMGRLAAYVAILELPETPVVRGAARPLLPSSAPDVTSGIQSGSSVDRDELILSELPT